MIDGTVTADREIAVRLEALAADASVVSIQAVVDTEFNGLLTLPMNVLRALGAPPVANQQLPHLQGRHHRGYS